MTKKKSTSLDAILAQYEENQKRREQKNNSGFNKEDYFSIYIPKEVTSAEKQIRILPSVNDGETPFTQLFIHAKEINGQKRKFTCLKEMYNKDCPFCDVRNELYERGDDGDKENAKAYYPRMTYVCRVIERDKEDEGVKFWRFNDDFRNQGIMDKLITIIKKKGDITNPETGRDITLHIGRDQNKNVFVTSITDDDPTPLSGNAEQMKLWLEHDKTWEDMYSVKPYEYLEIVVAGGIPVWDKDTETWVSKEVSDNEDEETKNEAKRQLEVKLTSATDTSDDEELNDNDTSTETSVTEQTTTSDDDDDDLPF